MPPAVASMIDLGTKLTSLPLIPVRLMRMKIQPSTNTAARASWYEIYDAGGKETVWLGSRACQ
jgi:hypothetical protein